MNCCIVRVLLTKVNNFNKVYVLKSRSGPCLFKIKIRKIPNKNKLLIKIDPKFIKVFFLDTQKFVLFLYFLCVYIVLLKTSL